MKRAVFAILAVAVLAAAPTPSVDVANAAQTVKKKSYRPLKGVIYAGRRPGGYSYSHSDSIDTRKFNDPALGAQAQGGPFDNGFFFETPWSPHGGTTPYMH